MGAEQQLTIGFAIARIAYAAAVIAALEKAGHRGSGAVERAGLVASDLADIGSTFADHDDLPDQSAPRT